MAEEFPKVLKHRPLIMYHALISWLVKFSTLYFAFKLLLSSVLFKSVEVYISFIL
jgi:hypothetical protein